MPYLYEFSVLELPFANPCDENGTDEDEENVEDSGGTSFDHDHFSRSFAQV